MKNTLQSKYLFPKDPTLEPVSTEPIFSATMIWILLTCFLSILCNLRRLLECIEAAWIYYARNCSQMDRWPWDANAGIVQCGAAENSQQRDSKMWIHKEIGSMEKDHWCFVIVPCWCTYMEVQRQMNPLSAFQWFLALYCSFHSVGCCGECQAGSYHQPQVTNYSYNRPESNIKDQIPNLV